MFDDFVMELSRIEREALKDVQRKQALMQDGDLFDDMPTESLRLERWQDRRLAADDRVIFEHAA